MDLKTKIRDIPDFPKKGILFRDITTMLKDPEAFCYVIDQLTEKYSNMDIDLIAGIESRGFILGATLAYKLKKGFVPIRKPGKLPAETISVSYCLEYGTDCVEMHVDAVNSGDRVLIVDDLLVDAEDEMFSLSDHISSTLARLFIFDFTSEDTVAGCFYLFKELQIASDCHEMTGNRTSGRIRAAKRVPIEAVQGIYKKSKHLRMELIE